MEWRIGVSGGETTAVFDPVTAGRSAVFVFAHGAGGHKDDRGMLQLSEEFRSRGLDIVRFNFLYRGRGSGRPDPMPLLKECLAAVVSRTRLELPPGALIIGGRSMGGRVASMLAAEGLSCDGLLLLAYPLHPAGRPEQLRDAHLSAITAPTLCFNGTRDSLCRQDLMEQALKGVKTDWTMRWLEGADHGFHVLKSSGKTDADILTEIAELTEAWVSRLVRR